MRLEREWKVVIHSNDMAMTHGRNFHTVSQFAFGTQDTRSVIIRDAHRESTRWFVGNIEFYKLLDTVVAKEKFPIATVMLLFLPVYVELQYCNYGRHCIVM